MYTQKGNRKEPNIINTTNQHKDEERKNKEYSSAKKINRMKGINSYFSIILNISELNSPIKIYRLVE